MNTATAVFIKLLSSNKAFMLKKKKTSRIYCFSGRAVYYVLITGFDSIK